MRYLISAIVVLLGYLLASAADSAFAQLGKPAVPSFGMSAVETMDPRFEPLHYLRHISLSTVPRYRFRAETEPQWKTWHKGLRKELTEAIGLHQIDRTDLKVAPGPIDEFDTYTRLAYTIETTPGLYVPAFLLIPKGIDLPRPAVVVLHGHGYGMNSIVGLNEDGTVRQEEADYQHDMGLQCVRAGFVTLVYDQLGFGRRRDQSLQWKFPQYNFCEQPSKWGLHIGLTMAGLRTFDAIRMIDFLQQREEVLPDKIGMVGISGGGLVTQFAAGLDDRIKAACISGHLNLYQDSILELRHCIDNYVPGMGQLADNDDIACLIAPRPLLVESGIKDRFFPISAARKAFSKLEQCYTLLRARENLDSDFFDREHEFSGAKTWTFLREHLCDENPPVTEQE